MELLGGFYGFLVADGNIAPTKELHRMVWVNIHSRDDVVVWHDAGT